MNQSPRLFQIIILVTSMLVPVAGRCADSADLEAALAGSDLPYAEVEAAMALMYDGSEPAVQSSAERFFKPFALAPSSALHRRGPEAALRQAREVLELSSFRRAVRELILREIEILRPAPRVTRHDTVAMSDQEAWRLGSLRVRQVHPEAQSDPARFTWEFRTAHLRNLNREISRAQPRAAPLTKELVEARLYRLYHELVKLSVRHFFRPSDLSLYEAQIRPEADGREMEWFVKRRTFRTYAELDKVEWITGDRILERTSQYRLALTESDERIRELGGAFGSEISLLSSITLGRRGAELHSKTADWLTRPAPWEALYQNVVSQWILAALNMAQRDPPAAALSYLRSILKRDIETGHFKAYVTNGYHAYDPHLTFSQADPDYFRRRDRRAAELGRPSLVQKIRRDARARPSLRGLDSFFGGEAQRPRNTSRGEVERQLRQPLFKLEGPSSFLARSIYYDLPVPSASEVNQPWTSGLGREIFALTSVGPIQAKDGTITVPTTSYGRLGRLRITREGRALREGVDYRASTDAARDRVLITLTEEEPVELRLGYVRRTSSYFPAAREIDFDHLDVTGVIAELRRGRLTKLAGRLERAGGRLGRLSADQILNALAEDFRYSYDEAFPRSPRMLARGPFAEYSGFLDDHDRFQLQCDGANAMLTRILRHIFGDDGRIEVRVVTCLVQEPSRGMISRVKHARTQVFVRGARAAIFDATPADVGESVRGENATSRITGPAPDARLVRLAALRAELIERTSIRGELSKNFDTTELVPTALRLGRDVVRAGGRANADHHATAVRYRRFLLARSRASHGATDPVAMAELDELLRLVQDLSQTCEDVLLPHDDEFVPDPGA